MKKRSVLLFFIPALLALAVFAAALICRGGMNRAAGSLPVQSSAERWQGEGETPFAMVSCFMPADSAVGYNEIIKFRYDMLKAENDAGLQANEENTVFRDAWSVKTQLNVKSVGKSSYKSDVIAVGGHFFDIHPLKLLSGSFFSEDDLMQDRVILDRNTAWRLFGGTDLTNMTMDIEGIPFVVCGVVDLEDDEYSEAAIGENSLLFMSFSALEQITDISGVSCYEILSPEPVDGFALKTIKENFKLAGTVIQNTGRFERKNLKELRENRAERSMVSGGYDFPYWENAAKSCEDSILRLSAASTALFIISAVMALACAGGIYLFLKRRSEAA